MTRALIAVLLCGSTTAAFADSFDAGTGLKLENIPVLTSAGVATNLYNPTDMRFLPDNRMIITQKSGEVIIRGYDGKLSTAGTFSVDTDSEKGLLGVEIDPNFTTNRRLFFYYTKPSSGGHNVVSVILGSDDTFNPASQTVLVTGLLSPANHDGGGLAIGPDGKLYIGVGDTGCNHDCCPAQNMFSTCLTNGNGKILRINLDGSIPSDNPLVPLADGGATACGSSCTDAVSSTTTGKARTEIWGWGFRNPFRFTFDKMTNKLWVGDVGETAREEVTIAQMGHHHGYPWFEGLMGPGDSSYDLTKCNQITPGAGNCVQPIWDCSHSTPGCQSITGGVFVDNPAFGSWSGNYFFGDNAQFYLSVLKVNSTRDGTTGANPRVDIGKLSNNYGPTSFHIGPDGNVYVTVFPIPPTAPANTGRLVRIAPAAFDGGAPNGPPTSGAGGGGAGGGVAGTGGGSGGGGISTTDGGTGGGSAGGTATGGGGAAGTGGGVAGTGGAAGGGGTADGGTCTSNCDPGLNPPCACATTPGASIAMLLGLLLGTAVIRRQRRQ